MRPHPKTESRWRPFLWSLLRVALASVVGFYIVVGGYLWLSQDSMVYQPPRQLELSPTDLGLAHDEVWLETEDGVRLHAWYVPRPAAAEPGAPYSTLTLLYFHGNAENLSHLGYALSRWHAAGFATLAVDYRGYGRSGGRPSERGTYLDAQAAWEYLAERPVAADRIVVWGRSLGGAVATWLASRQTPAALVLQSSFASVPELGADLYPWLPVRWLARYRYDSRELLPRVRCPVLIAHSRQDEIVPFRHAEELFAAATGRKRLVVLGGGHNDGAEALQVVPPALAELLADGSIVTGPVSD